MLPPAFLSRRFDPAWPNPVSRFLFCLVYIALPNSFEEFGNVTNSQWYLSILAFLILASALPRTAIGRAADILTLIVSGLTGPFCIFLFPIAVWRWRRARDLDGLIRLGRAGFCASVQGAFLLVTMAHDRAPTDLGVGFGNLARIIAMQVVLGVTGGSHVMSRINEAASWRDGVAPVAIASLAGAIFVVALLRGTALFRMFAVFGALVFAAALASPVGIRGGPAWPILAHPGAEQRYYLIPMLVFVGAISTLAADRYRLVRGCGCIGCCGLVIGIIGDWPYPGLPRTSASWRDNSRSPRLTRGWNSSCIPRRGANGADEEVMLLCPRGGRKVCLAPDVIRKRPAIRETGRMEITLYRPVKAFLERLGFEVKGEVRGCDVVAVRPGEPPLLVIAELKLGFSLELVLQAVERLQSADEVWLAVPMTRRGRDRDSRAHRLCKLLGIGLLAVSTARDAVEIIVEPGPYKPRTSQRKRGLVLQEFTRRQGDPNIGGSNKRKLMTAYRQQALACAMALQDGPKRPRDLREAAPDAPKILARNVYGWFERVRNGVYALAPLGHEALETWRAPP